MWRAWSDSMFPAETLPQRIERAGPDIPIHHPERAYSQRCQVSAGRRAGFHRLFLAARQDGFKVRWLFLAGDDADFDLLEPGRFEPAMKVTLGKPEPAVAVQLVRAFKLMFRQVQDHNLAARFQQTVRARNRFGRIL